jgi:hypothetical protein
VVEKVRNGREPRGDFPPLLRHHAALENDQMPYEPSDLLREELQVVLALREQHRRSTFVDGTNDVVRDELIPRLVARQRTAS